MALAVAVSRISNDLLFRFRSSSDSIRVVNNFLSANDAVEKAVFADGTIWDLTKPTFTWIGNGTNDTLNGSAFGSNLFTETASGTHTFNGSNNNDTYLYTPGNGSIIINETNGTDTVQFAAGVSPSDVYLQAIGSDLYFRFLDSTDSIRVVNNFLRANDAVEKAVFADGTTWDLTKPLTFTWIGNGTNDTLSGNNNGNNLFSETASGTHTFNGSNNNDTYLYTPGNGSITINESFGTDTLQFAAGVSPSDVYLQSIGSDLYFRFRSSTDSIRVVNNFLSTNDAVEKAVFADGTTWDLTKPLTFTWIGNGTNDTLTGSNNGNNLFSETASGTHTFNGSNNNDIYLYTPGNGSITINETFGTDTLQFAAGVLASNVYLLKSGFDLTFNFWNSTDSVRVQNDFLSSSHAVEKAAFADGTTWDLTHTVVGTTGNDILTGSSGNDIFFASAGTDSLTGGGGYDTYKFGTTFGHTVLHNLASDGVTTANGEIDFGAGVAHDQLWFKQSGNDLQIDLLGTNQDVTVSGWFAGNARAQVQSVNTSDGLKLDSRIGQLVSAMATYAANNPTFNPTQATQMPQDQTLQNTISAAWHS